MSKFYGTPGNDTLYGTLGNDTLIGGSGDDYLDAGYGFDLIDGRSGIDTTSYEFYYGPIYANLVTGVVSFPGNSIYTDTLVSIENVLGTDGDDSITGNNADNYLKGGYGNDSLYGGNGNDLLDAGFGFDVIDGGAGNDSTSYTFYSGPIHANLLTGVVAFPGNSFLTDTLISIENLFCTGGNDVISANYANNDLFGNGGNDYLMGNSGYDRIYGGAGNDTISGGSDMDLLSGEKGADVFDFDTTGDSGNKIASDSITDFKLSEGDKIDLSDIDANTISSGNQAFIFINDENFNAAGQLRFNAATHLLSGNTDADSAPELVIQLNGVTSLSAAGVIL